MNDPAAAIQTALNLLGPDGSRWDGGNGQPNAAATADFRKGGYDYCVVGALIAASPDQATYAAAYTAVKQAVGGNIARWNNSAHTDFPVVQLTLRRAANNLLEAGAAVTL